MKHCPVSVIIIAYNMQKYILQSILSIIYQSLPPQEIIVVDNGSNDNTGRLLIFLQKLFPTIHIISFQTNIGLACARNYAFKFITKSYFCFVDADDLLRRDALKKMYNSAKTNAADIVTCNVLEKRMFFYRAHHPSEWYKHNTLMSIEECPEQFFEQAAWAKLIKTEYAKKITYSFTDKSCFCEDVPAATNLFLNTKKICTLPSLLYKYRIRKDSFSHHFSQSQIDDFIFAMKAQDTILHEKNFDSYEVLRCIYEARLLLGNLLLSRLALDSVDYYFANCFKAFECIETKYYEHLFQCMNYTKILYEAIMCRDSTKYRVVAQYYDQK